VSDQDPSQEGEYQIDIRKYREAEQRAAAKEREAEELRNQLVLKDVEHAAQLAGIPTGTGAGKAFVAGYNGPNDPDAMKAAAIEFGIFRPEGSDAGGTPADAAQQQVDADRAALQNSGLAPNVAETPPSAAPGEEGLRHFDERLKEGKRREDAFPEILDRLVDAANKGDTRALVVPEH